MPSSKLSIRQATSILMLFTAWLACFVASPGSALSLLGSLAVFTIAIGLARPSILLLIPMAMTGSLIAFPVAIATPSLEPATITWSFLILGLISNTVYVGLQTLQKHSAAERRCGIVFTALKKSLGISLGSGVLLAISLTTHAYINTYPLIPRFSPAESLSLLGLILLCATIGLPVAIIVGITCETIAAVRTKQLYSRATD